jgi:DnaK suppressor protein
VIPETKGSPHVPLCAPLDGRGVGLSSGHSARNDSLRSRDPATRAPGLDLLLVFCAEMRTNVDVVQAELARARAGLEDLKAEYAALADPENVGLDDEHDAEGSTVGLERARVAGLLDRSRRQVAKLEAAVRRAADGSYGYCTSCGREIGTERLAALPATQLCIGCAN